MYSRWSNKEGKLPRLAPLSTLQPKMSSTPIRNVTGNLKFDNLESFANSSKIVFFVSKRRTSVFSGLRVNRSFSSDVEAAAGSSYGSRISVVGNRIQLFAEEETVPETQTDHCDSRPTLEEAQDLLCYRKTDSARSVCTINIYFQNTPTNWMTFFWSDIYGGTG